PDGGGASAGRGRAGEVCVAQRVHRAVEAGVLAVPDAEHAVLARSRQVAGQLRAVDRGGGELLVEPGDEVDAVLAAQLAEAHDLLVEAAEPRALAAGGEGGGLQGAA